MKARLVKSPPVGDDWIYEIKFDGYRAVAAINAGHAELTSRNGKDFGERFPELIEALAALKIKDAVIDGEIVALDKKGVSSVSV
jgi:bifunctional non-homologous end joining protein LigD